MGPVASLQAGSDTVPHPAWPDVQRALDRVAEGVVSGGILEGSQDAYLTFSHASGYGIYVTAMEDGELGEHILTDPSLAPQFVSTTIEGLPQEEPQCALVSKELALAAVHAFWELGRRAPSLTWRDPFELEREAESRRA